MNNDNSIKMIVFDWAGTTVDYGSSAPSGVFDIVLQERELSLLKKK